MKSHPSRPRYNQLIRDMQACLRRRWRLELRTSLWLLSLLLALCSLSPHLFASNISDAARQLAGKIAAITGPGSFSLEVTNRSSIDEKSVHEVRVALQGQLRSLGVHMAGTEQAMGSLNVVLSESLREFVWTAEIAVGTDASRVVMVSLPRASVGSSLSAAPPITLKATPLLVQGERILDVALIDNAAGAGSGRLLALEDSRVAVYRQESGHWQTDASLPIAAARAFPRDLRGRIMLRRDHLFDVYLPGTFCRSSAAMPLTLTCSASDDPWPLTAEDTGAVRAFYAPTRNFFTGVLSPGIGKISNLPAFYSAAVVPRQGYTLWAISAVDGSAHVTDGVTDQAIRGAQWGSDLAVVRSGCGTGAQLLVSGEGDAAKDRDTVRAYEIPDREPVAVSTSLEFDGMITALWADASGTSALVVVKREDTGRYEASRITVACGN